MKRSILALLILLLAVPAGAAQTRLRGFWPALGDYVSGSGVVAGDLDMDLYDIIDPDVMYQRPMESDLAAFDLMIKAANAYERAITEINGGPLLLGGGLGVGNATCIFADAPGTILTFTACDATGCTTTSMTEGTHWNRDTDNDLTCAALETYVDGLGLRFTTMCVANVLWVDPAYTMTHLALGSADGVGGGTAFVTVDGAETIKTASQTLIGATADPANYPDVALVSSAGDAEWPYAAFTSAGIVGENVVGSKAVGAGVLGVARTTSGGTGYDAHGVYGAARVQASADTASAIGVTGESAQTHAGGMNIAFSANANGGASNYGLSIEAGDVRTVNDADWDLFDNNASALSFDAVGHAGLLVLDTTDSVEMVRIGSTATSVDFPRARSIVSRGDTGDTSTGFAGLVGEAASTSSYESYGLMGTGKVSVARAGYGIYGRGKVNLTGDAGAASGGAFFSEDTHAGGWNIALSGTASGGATNAALSLPAGDINTSVNALDWDLIDDNAAALSLDAPGQAGILSVSTKDTSPGLNIVGGLYLASDTNGYGNVYLELYPVEASGYAYGLQIYNEIYQTGTATWTDIYIDSYENTLGSGGHYLADWYVDSGRKFSVDNSGALYAAGVATFGSDVATVAAADWDLLDNNASALSFDAAGKAGILEIDTTDGAEGVKMSGTYLLAPESILLGGTGATFPMLKRTTTYVYFKLADDSDYASMRAEEGWFQAGVILIDAAASFSHSGKSKYTSSANGITERTNNLGDQGLREDLTVDGVATYTDEVGGPLSVVHTGTFTHNETVTSDAKVTTTDALDNLIASITLADGEVLVVEVTILGRERDGSDRNMYHIKGLFYRQGGAAVQQGVSTYIAEVESDVDWCGDLAVNGNDVQITVDGNGDTVDWEVTYTYQILVSAA